MPTFQQTRRWSLAKMALMKSLATLPALGDSRPFLDRYMAKANACWAVVLAILCLSGAARAQGASDYLLGGGDAVKIVVFLSPELTTETRVSEQGLINFPMVGSVKIGGLSLGQAETLLSDKLKQGGFIQKAQVLINITTYRSQMVSLLGNVSKPGRYPIEVPGTRLTELLATAGGITASGADTVIITRQAPSGKVEKIEVDLPSIFIDGKTQLDMVLKGGDSIYVHRQPNFYIAGAVGRPGIYPVDRGMTVSQAIAKGGSYTLRSRESGVRLIRRDAGGKMIESIPKMDEVVQAEDQIFVRESLF